MTAPLTDDEKRSRILALLAARDAEQRDCRHVFMPVVGTTAYLRCPKCGARCDNEG
jgi:hypothetical protein